MIDYEQLRESIDAHKRNIATGKLKFDSDERAIGYLFALDDILRAMDELRLCWSVPE